MRALLGTMATVFLLGCANMAANGPLFTNVEAAPTTSALVYVYRAHENSNRNAFPYLHINGIQKAPLKDAGYLVYQLPPGPARFEVIGSAWSWGASDMAVNPTLVAGKKYFFELRSTPTFTGMLYTFKEVPELQARAQLVATSLSQ